MRPQRWNCEQAGEQGLFWTIPPRLAVLAEWYRVPLDTRCAVLVCRSPPNLSFHRSGFWEQSSQGQRQALSLCHRCHTNFRTLPSLWCSGSVQQAQWDTATWSIRTVEQPQAKLMLVLAGKYCRKGGQRERKATDPYIASHTLWCGRTLHVSLPLKLDRFLQFQEFYSSHNPACIIQVTHLTDAGFWCREINLA